MPCTVSTCMVVAESSTAVQRQHSGHIVPAASPGSGVQPSFQFCEQTSNLAAADFLVKLAAINQHLLLQPRTLFPPVLKLENIFYKGYLKRYF